MFQAGNRDGVPGSKKPPLVTALTALIINGFFIRSRSLAHSLDCHVTSIDPEKRTKEKNIIFAAKKT